MRKAGLMVRRFNFRYSANFTTIWWRCSNCWAGCCRVGIRQVAQVAPEVPETVAQRATTVADHNFDKLNLL